MEIDVMRYSDTEFDNLVNRANSEDLMKVVRRIQSEMTKEQQRFNSLNAKLSMYRKTDAKSADVNDISAELMETQNRLTLLMSRNMKCFIQQSNKPNDAKAVSLINNNRDNVLSTEPRLKAYSYDDNARTHPPTTSIEVSQQQPTEKRQIRVVRFQDQTKHDSHQPKINTEASSVERLNSNSSQAGVTPTNAPSQHHQRTIPIRPAVTNPVSHMHAQPVTVQPLAKANHVASGYRPLTRRQDSDSGISSATISPKNASDESINSRPGNVNFSDDNSNRNTSSEAAAAADDNRGFLKPSQVMIARKKQLTQQQMLNNTPVVVSDTNGVGVELEPTVKTQQNVIPTAPPLPSTPQASSPDSLLLKTAEPLARSTEKRDGVDVSKPLLYEMEYLEGSDGAIEIGHDGSEKVKHRVTMKSWNPTIMLRELYTVTIPDNTQSQTDIPITYVNMEGVLEKLPPHKNKQTLLKTWKRRYFKARNGFLYVYESRNSENAQDTVQLMGGSFEALGPRTMGIDDGRGHYLIVRAPTTREFNNWSRSLTTQIVDNVQSTYIEPVTFSSPHESKKVIVVDLGSNSIRAGILGQKASLPTVFMPTIAAVNKDDETVIFGETAYLPEVRSQSKLVYPIAVVPTIDKYHFEMNLMPGLFQTIFSELKIVDPSQYLLMISTPHSLAPKIRRQFLKILLEGKHAVAGVYMLPQSLLALYLYNAPTGIIVDIGDRMHIFPMTEGYVVDSGQFTRCYGGRRTADALNSYLTENKFHFFTAVEYLIIQFILQRTCYISLDYTEECKTAAKKPSVFSRTINLAPYHLPKGTWVEVKHDASRFKAPEGIFTPEVWGMDDPGVHNLVYQAIQACPMDTRRAMARHIYLSGGATMLPGFVNRLKKELSGLLPESVVVQVHASEYRYHAAYIGATVVALNPSFEHTCVTREAWSRDPESALRRLGPSDF